MSKFTIFPAIDMRGGKCVRLYKGDYEQETIYADSPFDMAKRFADEGAEWIHMVDLDGAKDGKRVHAEDVVRAAKELTSHVQVGGGIRSIEDVAFYLDQGVDRAIIGSLAIQQPETVIEFLEQYGPERIVIGLDAKDGMVATHGWLETSTQSAIDVAKFFVKNGAKYFIFTDIATDGTLQGPNIEANVMLAKESGASVIVSGGISSIDDIRNVRLAANDTSIEGAITGKALYENRFTLKEALSEGSTC